MVTVSKKTIVKYGLMIMTFLIALFIFRNWDKLKAFISDIF